MAKQWRRKPRKPSFRPVKAQQTWCRFCNTTIHVKNVAGLNKYGKPLCIFCDDRFDAEGWDHTCYRSETRKTG